MKREPLGAPYGGGSIAQARTGFSCILRHDSSAHGILRNKCKSELFLWFHDHTLLNSFDEEDKETDIDLVISTMLRTTSTLLKMLPIAYRSRSSTSPEFADIGLHSSRIRSSLHHPLLLFVSSFFSSVFCGADRERERRRSCLFCDKTSHRS